MDKYRHTIFSLLMLFSPIALCAGSVFSADNQFGLNWTSNYNTQDIYRAYQQRDVVNRSSFDDGMMIKEKPLQFETTGTQGGQVYFDYPDNIASPVNDDVLVNESFFSLQNSRAYKLIPKDLVPYLGLRMKYTITDKFGLVNDITPKNIFYRLTYSY